MSASVAFVVEHPEGFDPGTTRWKDYVRAACVYVERNGGRLVAASDYHAPWRVTVVERGASPQDPILIREAYLTLAYLPPEGPAR